MEITEKQKNNTLDRSSFEQLFRLHYQGMCYFALKYVKDMDIAREIVQDAYAGLWEKRENIDMERVVKSYLTTMVFNRCSNHLRDNRKFDPYLLHAENLTEMQQTDGADILVQSELQIQIDNAIAELPEKCREIFLLSRNENLKYQEIAEKLVLSVKTVEAQMSKALQHMRIRLAEYITVFIGILCALIEQFK